jgi:AsmA protein
LRYAGFRPKFEGQVSLDGRLNLKARIGLPPFGIFGIPLSVTGTQDNPIIRYRRGRKSDELQATEADEEDKKEAAEAEAKEKVEQEAKKKQ